MGKKTRLLLVDDHTIYREGLRELLAKWDDFEIVGEADNGLEAIEFCRVTPPDMVLMDVYMPVVNGLDACAAIVEDNPRIAVVMLSNYGDRDRVVSAIANGAKGYLLKTICVRQLHDRLRSVMKGGAALSEDVAAVCLEEIRSRNRRYAQSEELTSLAPSSLTDHENELLRLVALGFSNREIGERLYIGESTVKKQLSALMIRLGLRNRVQAAVFALRAGLAE